MRIVAILCAYNEERFIRACLENYIPQGVEVYLLDNESQDATADIAHDYLGHGLIAIERCERLGTFDLHRILSKKEEVAQRLKADWFIHADLDEIRLAPTSEMTLSEALYTADRDGYSAVNFMEFTFVPTRESPDHDHSDFQRTMRWYYPFARWYPQRVNAWKAQRHRSGNFLAENAGHRVSLPDLRIYPIDFKMRHYLYLSKRHAIERYCDIEYEKKNVMRGWHGWRNWINYDQIELPSQHDLRYYVDDDHLDASCPLQEHLILRPSAL